MEGEIKHVVSTLNNTSQRITSQLSWLASISTSFSSNGHQLLSNPQVRTPYTYNNLYTAQFVNRHTSQQFHLPFATMTPNIRPSPKRLIVYPHLHRSSQCHSCSTVTPGDICFNCGRLSTLLVTPRPPRKSMGHCVQPNKSSPPSYDRPALQSMPFGSQYDRTRDLLAAKDRPTMLCPKQRVFDSQLNEIENLLDARKKLIHVHTLAADDKVLLDDKDSNSAYRHSACSSRPFTSSSTAHSPHSSDSSPKTLPSRSVAISDILSEDGTPHAHVVAQWLEAAKPSGRSSAKLTRRGVDCRLNLAGSIHEWVIFL